MTDLPESPPERHLAEQDAAAARIRRQRNIVMALGLAAFVILVYAISIVKMTK